MVVSERRRFVPGHDRGRVLADAAVMLSDGGEAIGDIEVLRHQAVATTTGNRRTAARQRKPALRHT